MTQLINDIWGMEVEDYWQFFDVKDNVLSFDDSRLIDGNWNFIKLPPGQWKIIGKGSELSKEQWNGIVEKFNNGAYRDYSHSYFMPDDDGLPFYLTAIESGHSLLKAKMPGVPPEKILLLKQINNQ
jgi:hypothetical protein